MTGRGYFADDSAVRRINSESVLLLGGGRALLMQLAHPLVAAGVAEHSDFRVNPWSRLQRTLEATSTIVFGSRAAADRAAAGVRAVHERVVGPGYSANDPALLLWVHATLVDTAMRVYRRFIGSIAPADVAEYYEQSKTVAALLGCPVDAQPDSYDDFRAYVRSMLTTLEVSDVARALARDVLHPQAPIVLAPALELGRQLTAGLLPPPLRRGYGLSWDAAREAALVAAGLSSRAVLPRLPAFARRVPMLSVGPPAVGTASR